jgi:hypothetical protein
MFVKNQMLIILTHVRSGITMVMSSSTAVVIALTWGGAEYSWSSAPVLVPLTVGMAGLAVFLMYEARYAKHPLVSFQALA